VPYIDTIVEEARRRDYDVLLSTVREGPEGLTRLARRSVCDAFVIMDIQENDDRLGAAAALGRPVVLMGQPAVDPGLDVVAFNWGDSAEQLVDELASTGHRHIAVLREPRDGSFKFVNEFYDAARARAAQHGIDFYSVQGADGWRGIMDVSDRLLEHRNDRLGLMTRNPRLTEQLVQLLQVSHITPGVDVSLVSACSDRVALGYERPVTNVSAKPRELSALAMKLLFERLDEPSRAPRLEILKPNRLVRRATTVDYTAAS
jgi:DNA-binding LacI/PurR family transcriptional regulator